MGKAWIRLGIWATVVLVGMAASLPSAAANPDVPRALFASHETIAVTIEAENFSTLIARADRDTRRYPATLRYETGDGKTVSLPMEISARGQTRRKKHTCRFPPLRLYFEDKAQGAPLFAGHYKLKLVTHCDARSANEQFALLEYLAYRIYNLLTPNSYRVRLARMSYVRGARSPVMRYGFFIEDTDDVAERNGRIELSVNGIKARALEPESAALLGLFQLLIANLDWSVTAVQGDGECCHNAKLSIAPDLEDAAKAGEIPDGSIVALPYDFDYSGLVDAPYAVVGPGARTRKVRQRLYWGFCRHNDHLPAAIARVQQERDAILALVANIDGLQEYVRKKTRRYIEAFFEILDDPDAVEREIIRDCR